MVKCAQREVSSHSPRGGKGSFGSLKGEKGGKGQSIALFICALGSRTQGPEVERRKT